MEKEPEKFRAIIAELQSMVEIDQAMRNRCINNFDQWDETVDRRNTERLKAIVEEIGWPSISKVGPEGSHNAWLLVQHADRVPLFQKHCLELMKAEPENVDKRRKEMGLNTLNENQKSLQARYDSNKATRTRSLK